jgi:transcriptional regulator with XRE-family HTH domain
MDTIELCGMARKIISQAERTTRELTGRAIAERIQAECRRTGDSVSEVRTRVGRDAGGKSKSTIKRIEEGTVGANLDTLSCIAQRFGCTVADLVSGTPPAEPTPSRRRGDLLKFPAAPRSSTTR